MMKRIDLKTWAFLSIGAGFISTALGAEKLEGEVDYQTHCMACHMVNVKTVGPSLVYMAKTYPKRNFEEFKAWVKEPGKKDPKLIQMPAMGHIPDDVMARIHGYILGAAKGQKEKKAGKGFEPFKEPKRPLPYVVRGFLPDTSPASIAVVMDGNLSVCWDTEICRLRYAWVGSRTSLNSYFGPAKLKVKPFYKEKSEVLWSLKDAGKPDFLGYRLIEGYPEFHYRLGSLEVHELVRLGEDGDIIRSFRTSGLEESATLLLNSEGTGSVTSDLGLMEQNLLQLTASEAASFTLTLKTK